jgi:hypothetical protein
MMYISFWIAAIINTLVIRSSLKDWQSMKKEGIHARHKRHACCLRKKPYISKLPSAFVLILLPLLPMSHSQHKTTAAVQDPATKQDLQSGHESQSTATPARAPHGTHEAHWAEIYGSSDRNSLLKIQNILCKAGWRVFLSKDILYPVKNKIEFYVESASQAEN